MANGDDFDGPDDEDSEEYDPFEREIEFDKDFEAYRQERMEEMIEEGLLKGDDNREEYLAEYLSLLYADDPRYADWDVDDWQEQLDHYEEAS